jgi:hypothetical protein
LTGAASRSEDLNMSLHLRCIQSKMERQPVEQIAAPPTPSSPDNTISLRAGANDHRDCRLPISTSPGQSSAAAFPCTRIAREGGAGCADSPASALLERIRDDSCKKAVVQSDSGPEPMTTGCRRQGKSGCELSAAGILIETAVQPEDKCPPADGSDYSGEQQRGMAALLGPSLVKRPPKTSGECSRNSARNADDTSFGWRISEVGFKHEPNR